MYCGYNVIMLLVIRLVPIFLDRYCQADLSVLVTSMITSGMFIILSGSCISQIEMGDQHLT